MTRLALSCLAPLLLTLVAGAAQAAGPKNIAYRFDTDAQGWTAQAGGALAYRSGDPRHGGYLEITDVSSDDFVVLPPPEALGDWSRFLGGTVRFLARNGNLDSPDWAPFGTLTLGNGTQSLALDAVPDGAPLPDGRWHRFEIPLTTERWGADLPAVLAGLSQLTLKLEFHAGVTEVVHFDAFRVTRPPVR